MSFKTARLLTHDRAAISDGLYHCSTVASEKIRSINPERDQVARAVSISSRVLPCRFTCEPSVAQKKAAAIGRLTPPELSGFFTMLNRKKNYAPPESDAGSNALSKACLILPDA